MTRIETYTDALSAIWAPSDYERGFISNPFGGDDAARRGLQRTAALLDHLGHPERSYPIVHVAGSKGKGSTCMIVDAILQAADVRTGRFLSPHLHSYRERFVVDDQLIGEEDFTTLTATVIDAAEQIERTTPALGGVTAFELSTAVALQWFAQRACMVAIIEVGLGGTLDATNVVDPAVSVITALDFEHTAILGETMPEIARNKAGIIKPGRPVVSAAQPPDGLAVIEARAAACGSPLYVAGSDWTMEGTEESFSVTGRWGRIDGLQSTLTGRHQLDNAGLALAAVHALGEVHPDVGVIDEHAIREGVAATRHPGRFESVDVASGQTVVIDGAHSPASAAALAAALADRFSNAQIALIVGMFTDKDPVSILGPLVDIAAHWIAVAPNHPRAMSAAELERLIDGIGGRAVVERTVAEAIHHAATLPWDVIVVTGSLTTAAEARVALNLASVVDRPR